MLNVIAVLLLLGGACVVLVGLILCVPRSKRRLGNRLVGFGLVAAVVGFGTIMAIAEREAKQAGFADAKQMRMAKEAGFTDPQLWAKQAAVLSQQEEQRRTEETEGRPEKDAQVQGDLAETELQVKEQPTAAAEPQPAIQAQPRAKPAKEEPQEDYAIEGEDAPPAKQVRAKPSVHASALRGYASALKRAYTPCDKLLLAVIELAESDPDPVDVYTLSSAAKETCNTSARAILNVSVPDDLPDELTAILKDSNSILYYGYKRHMEAMEAFMAWIDDPKTSHKARIGAMSGEGNLTRKAAKEAIAEALAEYNVEVEM